ncbi:MAG: LysM peptidoglycan-binding domain-containing protein [Desulfobacterales bacterium]|nr:LysM peptidoglycan-binding domain-containing protein [Desulfobacterales bacterium]
MRVKTVRGQVASFLPTILISLTWLFAPLAQGQEKDTLSISLVQQATVKRVEGMEVACEHYRVKRGDYIWKIMRQRGLLERRDFPELISILRSMNKSLTNLDLIHPGQTILIPLNITPVSEYVEAADFPREPITRVSSLKDISLENYVVKPGNTLTMIVQSKYKIPGEYLYEYLKLVQKFNPTVKNLDLIYPNQVIRLPIYSPEIVRMPIKPQKTGKIKTASRAERIETVPKGTKISATKDTGQTISLRKQLGDIFNQMGEEWVDTGEQFIPLRSGGQINLKAESFPTLNLRSGLRLIIDLKNQLPEDISRLIQADWKDYRIVRLAADDNLEAALDKILAGSNYYKILKSGEQFTVGGDVDISIAGDWVIIPHRGKRDITDKIAAISLISNPSERTPGMVRAYLEKLGIKVIDYPDFPAPAPVKEGVPIKKKITIEENTDFPLPTLLLTLAGQSFSSQVKIPVYKGGGSGFDLIMKADLFFNRKGKDCIIDFTGLPPDIISLLKKHQFLVLSLAGEKDPNRMTERILDFLGLPFDSKPHHFLAAARDEARNIRFTIPGISFHDREGKKILATDKKMQQEIVSFLSQKGYSLLELSQQES